MSIKKEAIKHPTAGILEVQSDWICPPSPPKVWRFKIGDRVRFQYLHGEDQIGTIRGRAEYVDCPDEYEIIFRHYGILRRKWRQATEIDLIT